MKFFSNLGKSALYVAAATLLTFGLSHAAHAQNIGAGNLTFSMDGASVSNGYYPGSTGEPVQAGVTQTGGVSVQGVSGNGGTTYVTCYDSVQGQIFSWATQQSGQKTFQWVPRGLGVHQQYCSADYTGNYANGTVSTPNISIQVN